MDPAELEKLSSKELHDRAMRHAITHLDVAWLWSLVKTIPAAEAAAGNVGEAETDVVSLSALVTDLVNADEGEEADALRPVYIDYLSKQA
jgi:hypothetical protein